MQLAGAYLMIASRAKTCVVRYGLVTHSGDERSGLSCCLTLEQQPPNMRPSMAPTASHCGMVSMNIRPASPMSLEKVGRWSSMPYNSAFSREGPALMTLGVTAVPFREAACDSRRVWRLRGTERLVIESKDADGRDRRDADGKNVVFLSLRQPVSSRLFRWS